MAKYNLMDTEKPEYLDRYFDEEDEDKKETPAAETEEPKEQSLPDIDEREYFDESLFTEDAAAEEPPSTPDALADMQSEQHQEQKKEEEQPVPEPENQIEEIQPPPPPPPKPEPQNSVLDDLDYEDSKMQGINWKPLLLWGTVIIVIAAIIFFAYNMFFSDGTESEAVEQPTISPEEQMRIDQQNRKIAFIKNIVSDKKSKLGNFSNLSNLKTSGVSYSSVLLYDNSFKFEIFGQSRGDIAKYNQNLKNNNFDDKFEIVTVDTRPGSNGGVFALYNVKPGTGGRSGSQSDPTIDGNVQNTVKNLVTSNSLKLISDRDITRKKVDQFNMVRKEINCSGTEANCIKLLNDLNAANANFNVHKISLIPSNQKNIKGSKYNLLIVFDFYV